MVAKQHQQSFTTGHQYFLKNKINWLKWQTNHSVAWAIVQEYNEDPIASDSNNEKKSDKKNLGCSLKEKNKAYLYWL